jgi:hypothetical protein
VHGGPRRIGAASTALPLGWFRPGLEAKTSRSHPAIVSWCNPDREPFARSAILPFSVALRASPSPSVLKTCLLAHDRTPRNRRPQGMLPEGDRDDARP